MHDALDRRLRWLYGTAAAAFALTASALALSSLGVLGNALSVDDPSLPWVPSAVAFSVTGAVLAARVAGGPRRYTFLMAVLGAAMLSSGATLVALRMVRSADVSSRAFTAAGSIDLGVAVVFFASWWRVWFAAVPGDERARRDEELLAALLHTLVPEGGVAALGAVDDRVCAEVLRRRSEGVGEARIRLELRLLDVAGRLLARESLAHAGADARADLLRRLCGSRLGVLRRIAVGWRDATLGSFYSDRRVLDAIGFDHGHLERRLAEGPNREEHRTRLGSTARAGADDVGPLRPDPDVPVLRLIRSGGPTST